MAWLFWVSLLVVVTVVFWRLWVLATSIEEAEQEEEMWNEYLKQTWQNNPEWGPYYQQQFEEKFLK